MSDEPKDDQKGIWVGFGVLAVVAGAWGLSEGEGGWAFIVIGTAILGAYALGKI